MKLSARQQKKTVLRTVRISEELDRILQKDAKVNRTSVNALISAIMEKYAEWDRYTEKFRYISIPTTIFRALLDLADENALATVAERLGDELPKEVTSFWFKKFNLETYLQYISNAAEYGNALEAEIESERGNYTIIIHHEYGKKWSTALKHYHDKAIRTYLKTIPHIETTENTVTLRFQVP
jgi:hypothetical protein